MKKKRYNELFEFLRKTDLDDPTHKWIGTYNTRQIVLSNFFRWLYNLYQNNESDQKMDYSSCMQGIKQLTRKETSPYKPSDIWTNKDMHFLKYCPEKETNVIMQWQMIYHVAHMSYFHLNSMISNLRYHQLEHNMQRFTYYKTIQNP